MILNLIILCAISLKALSWLCVIVLNRAFLWAESVCPNNFRKYLSSLMSLIMVFLRTRGFQPSRGTLRMLMNDVTKTET